MKSASKMLSRVLAGVCVAGMMTASFTGCKSSGTSAAPGSTPAGSPTGTAVPQPAAISFMMPLYDAQPPQLEGNPVFEACQKMTNTKITIDYVPNPNYQDKLNLTIAGGTLPDVVMVPATMLKLTAVINGARTGAFWDCTGEMGKYSNLGKYINDIVKTNASIDGKAYGVPIPRPTARVGLVYRKDLFSSQNIKVPTSLEEIYTTAKDIKAKIPDLTPFYFYDTVSESTWNGIDFFTVAQGGFNIWGLKDNKVTPYYDTSEYMSVLKFFKKMYSEGLINKDFGMVNSTQKDAAIPAGKAAMTVGAYDSLILYTNNIKKVLPNAQIGLQPVLSGKTNSTPGHNGIYMISKGRVKTQAQLDSILAYFNRFLDEDMILLSSFGIEGTHYNKVNGVPTFINDEAKTKFAADGKSLTPRVSPVFVRWTTDSADDKFVKDSFENYGKIAVPNLADPFVSQTNNEKGGNLSKIVYDARVKYIMGELDDNGYTAAVESWKNQGGNSIIAEFTEAYTKAKGK